MKNRKDALEELLQPITWCPSSSIRSRQELVVSKRRKVLLVLPFLNKKEQTKALLWLHEERHSDLWD